MTSEKTQLIDVEDLATRLAVSKRTVWRLEMKGVIPAPLRLGKTVRWRESDIEEWFADGCPCRRERPSA